MNDETSTDQKVQVAVSMPKQLREDAKRNTEHGELSEAVRAVYRSRAYGDPMADDTTELERTKRQLEEVRNRIDELRLERDTIDTEIKNHEKRATRLEERVTRLKQDQDDTKELVATLEENLRDGERMWPTWIKNNYDVSMEQAERLYHELRGANDDLPEAAFTEPAAHTEADWTEATQ